MARNPLIGSYDNVRSLGTLSGGSWTTAAPLTNLKDHNPQVVAESTDHTTASTQFDVDFGSDQTVAAFFFAGIVPSTSAATMRVVAKNAAAATTYDSGVVAVKPVADANEWIALGRTRIFVPSAAITAKTAEVDFDTSAVAGTLKVGVFSAFQVFEPTYGMVPDPQMEYLDETALNRVPGGSMYITESPIRRRFTFALQGISDITSVAAIMAIKGQHDPTIIIPYPDTSAQLERMSVYGLFQNLGWQQPLPEHYQSAFTVEQLV